MILKFTGDFCAITIKNDAKLEKELTRQFRTGMRNFTNFDRITQKSHKFAL